MRLLIAALIAWVAGCVPGLYGRRAEVLEPGALEPILEEAATPESRPVTKIDRLALAALGFSMRSPGSEILLSELETCGQQLRKRGLVSHASVLRKEIEPTCPSGSGAEACVQASVDAYRKAAITNGDDGLLVASLGVDRPTGVTPVSLPGTSLLNQDAVYVTEGGILEVAGGGLVSYARGESDSPAAGAREDVPRGRSPAPELMAQSARRFCKAIEDELRDSPRETRRRERERLLEIEARRQQREREKARQKDVDVEPQP